jgi:hypothetical protein
MALIGSTGGQTFPAVVEQGGPAVKEYDVEINGVTTTLQLSDRDAEARGLKKPATTKEKQPPANKEASKPANKAASASQKADG